MLKYSEKHARFSRIPENEDCEDLLPSNEALERPPPRRQFPQLLPTVLMFVIAICTSTISFWFGRKWESTSDPSSWVKEITNYCKRASELISQASLTPASSTNSRRRPSPLHPNTIQRLPAQRKHFSSTSKPRSRRSMGDSRRQLSPAHHPLLPGSKVRSGARPSEDQSKIRRWLPRERRRTTPSSLPEPPASKPVVQLRVLSQSW